MAPPRGMFPISSVKGSHIFSLGDSLGVSVRGASVDGCSSRVEVLGGRMRRGDGGACPNSKWYKVARAPLSSCRLWHRVAWQEERMLWWLLLSSSKACSSRLHRFLLCSSWNITAWEVCWALASPMALEQATLAAWIEWHLVVLASMMVVW